MIVDTGCLEIISTNIEKDKVHQGKQNLHRTPGLLSTYTIIKKKKTACRTSTRAQNFFFSTLPVMKIL